MGNIKIRKFIKSDADIVKEINYKTWLEVYPNEEYGITVDDIKKLFSKKKEKKINKDCVTYVAIIDDELVGFCFGCLREKTNQLQAIYILSKHRNKGVGRMLLNKLLDEFFDKNKNTIVNVAIYNTNAINTYKKWGFVDTGKRFSKERFRFKSGSIMPEMELLRKK